MNGDGETALLMITRVGFETIGVVFDGKIGGVELPDEERMSEIEFVRS